MGVVKVDFDHHSADFAHSKEQICDELLERCPVAHTSAHGGYWVAASFDAVTAGSIDSSSLSNSLGTTIPANGIAGGLNALDAPQHTSFRKLLLPWFSPASAERQTSQLEADATWLIDQVIESGRAEVVHDIVGQLPAITTLRMLGIPLENFDRYAEALHRANFTPPGHPLRPEVDELLGWIHSEMRAWVRRKRDEPRDDYLSFLAQLEIDGERLSEDRLVAEGVLILGAGLDTVATLLAHTVIHLDAHRDHRELLAADPSLLPAACDEFLRYYTPVPSLARTAVHDCTLDGVDIKEGDRLLLLYMAANADPKAFDNPHEFRIDRRPNRHLSFGVGRHRCIGAPLAAVTWRVMVGQLLARLPDYKVLTDEVEPYYSQGHTNGFIRVPIEFTPGPRITNRQSPEKMEVA